MTEETPEWIRKRSRIVAECRVFRVREDECQRSETSDSASFFVIENPDWVNIVAVAPDDGIILIEQFRHGVARQIVEIPGGMIDPGEKPLEAAKRELLEETGFVSQEWVELGSSFPNPAIQNNTIHHFLAVGATKQAEVSFDEHENISTRLVPLREIRDLVHNGVITHSLAITALYYAERHLKL